METLCDDIDDAMNMCFMIFTDAAFSWWNSYQQTSWLDVYASEDDHTIVGKIFELE